MSHDPFAEMSPEQAKETAAKLDLLISASDRYAEHADTPADKLKMLVTADRWRDVRHILRASKGV